MKKLGLIGYPLSHSFSKKYFSEKFIKEDISNYEYELYPLETVDGLPKLIKSNTDLVGLNVTIPYKERVIDYQLLDSIHPEAFEIGAVNTIKIINGKLIGYNTDVYGFEKSLLSFLQKEKLNSELPIEQALVLGTGGAAKAVLYILQKLNVKTLLISRTEGKGDLTYNDLDKKIMEASKLIINTTPLGMYPNVENCPDIPYRFLTDKHFLYDLLYNPEKTLFLNKGIAQGASTKNGLDMLILQAEKSWEIWNQKL